MSERIAAALAYEISEERLSEIKIIFCAPYTLGLYGIPYEMRRDVAQEPRHLWRFERTEGWIWLGTPGWYGSMTAETIERVKRYLDERRALDQIPRNPYEWCRVAAD